MIDIIKRAYSKSKEFSKLHFQTLSYKIREGRKLVPVDNFPMLVPFEN